MAHNDITGDSIRVGKGSAEKYAQGWDRLFGKKAEEPPMQIGHFMVDDYMCPNCGTPWKCNGPHVDEYESAPTTVMALDFHDGAL